jgi:diguanylate cyclase (GGDEF)-like protein
MAEAAAGQPILVVDDDPNQRMLVKLRLEAEGYRVREASDGEEAIESIREESPGVVLLDVMMPKMDGYETSKAIKSNPLTAHIPIIMLTAKGDVSDRVDGLDKGADDYLTKPFDPRELVARVRASMRVKELQDQLKEMAIRDELTGLHNRRYFDQAMDSEVTRANRYGRDLCCLMIDVDHFKRVNDTHGHDIGDAALATIARLLNQDMRATDVVARYGGEEFVVLLPETELSGAAICAERVLDTVRSHAFHEVEGLGQITVSVGVAALDLEGDETGEKLVDHADAALYEAKNGGRDRGMVATPEGFKTPIEVISSDDKPTTGDRRAVR